MRARAGRSACAALVLAVAVAGCSAPGSSPLPTFPIPQPGPLPDGVSVSVFQTRADVPLRRLEIQVTNESPAAIVVTGARFESTQLAEPADWTMRDSSTIRPGRTVNLPVELGAADCSSSTAEHVVRLEFEQDFPRVAEVAPTDRFGRLPALRAEDCLAQSVEQVAAVALTGPLRTTIVDGTVVGSLRLTIAPTGASGSLALGRLRGAILIALADPASGAIVESRELSLDVSGTDDPSSVSIHFVPNRCDAHAIAEDKRGTLLPLEVSAGEFEGVYPVPVSGEVRSRIYDYLAEACGLGG